MGQKVSPKGLRIGVNREWDAQWYAGKNEVADLLLEDQKIRKYLAKTYAKAQVSRVVIERVKGTDKDIVNITLYTAKPGVVIGRDAETKNNVVKELEYLTKKSIRMNVNEVKKPELDATLVARSIAEQLEARASFRRVQKIAQQRAMKAGAKGVKTLISGRLGGAEIARGEGYSVGQVPLQTLRADIDYAQDEAHTTYGKLGVKVWIYKGEVLNLKKAQEKKALEEKANRDERNKRFNNRNGKKDAARPARRPRTNNNDKSSEGGK
jgi:small subunit ribosomal protein S3